MTISMRKRLAGLALALSCATALAAGIASPAFADSDHRGHAYGEERHERERHVRDERREHEWRERHAYVYTAPAPIYAPPPVVYYPPPPPAGINIVIPLNLR